MAATAAALRQSALCGSIGVHQQDNVLGIRQQAQGIKCICKCRMGREHLRNDSFSAPSKVSRMPV